MHPKTAFAETVPHPIGVNTAPEYIDYSAEGASWAVDLLLEILTACGEAPREPLREWAVNARKAVKALSEQRSSRRAQATEPRAERSGE